MTKKLLHVVVFLATTFALHSQAPGYFGKTFYASAGAQVDYFNANFKVTPGVNLEFGKMLSKTTGVVVQASYSTSSINTNMSMRGPNSSGWEWVDVNYELPITTYGVVWQSYVKTGAPAPIGMYSKYGVVRYVYNVKIKDYTNDQGNKNEYGEVSADRFDLPEKVSDTQFRIGVGYNMLVTRSAMVTVESVADISLSQSGELYALFGDSGWGRLALKVSYTHFLF